MEQLGIDFNATGSVMSKAELEELRRKRGECITCGRKCFQKRLFKMIPITDHGRVLNGRCLNCKPLDANEGGLIPAVSRPATAEDLARFSRSQSNLGPGGGGGRSASNSGLSGAGVRPASRRPSSRSYSGSEAAARSATPAAASLTSMRPPGRSQSLSSGQVVAQHAEAPRGRPSDQDSSSSRGQAASSRERSITPSNSQKNMGSAPIPPPVDFDSGSSPGHPSADSRRRYPPLPLDIRSAHSNDPYGREMGDAYGDALETRSVPHNDYNTGHDLYPPGDLQSEAHSSSQNEYYNHENHSQRSFGAHSQGGEPPQSRRGVARHHSGDGNHTGPPRHGMLDRGGEITFVNNPQQPQHHNTPPTSSIARQMGSNRTLSSMSSMEEDIVNGRVNSQKRFVPPNHAFYEEDSINNNTIRSRDSAGVRSVMSIDDDRAIDRIHLADGDCAEILAVMRENLGSISVQSYALKELSCLHLGPEDQDRLAQFGAMELIVDAMHSYPEDLELQIHGCRAVWNGSGTPENQIDFVNSGALDIILSDMDRFIDNAEIQECAMGTLSNLAAAEPNLLRMIESGTVPRVVEAMNKHSENNLVQAKGCSAITNMASHLSPLKKDIMDMGGGGAVVICMVMHPDDFDLQEKALRALKNLSSNNDENKVELANIGAIDAVITAMQVHRDQPGVQEAGAWTLSNLASNNDNKAVIGDSGGIDVVIRAMWVHAGNVKVQEWCCRALYTLTLDRHNSGMVLQVGGISAVVNAMQAHVDSGPVQEMGCAVLCNLAFDESSKMRIVDEEALDAIVLAMVLYTDDAKVQESACEVLLQLAIVENFKSMQASNIGELASAAATKFPENCKEPALKLLHVLEGYCAEY
jgi:hypothetical protein